MSTNDRGARHVVVICHVGRAGYNVQRALLSHPDHQHTYLIHDLSAASLRWSRGCSVLGSFDTLETADRERVTALINDLHRRIGVSSVISTDVISGVLLSEIIDDLLPPSYPVPGANRLRQLNNKWEFTRLCMAHDIDVPKTLYYAAAKDADPSEIELTVGYPAIIKPATSFGQRGIKILYNADSVRTLRDVSYPDGIVVQEFIVGQDWSANVLAIDGDITHSTQWKAPSPLDTGYGKGRFLASTFLPNSRLAAMVAKIVEATRYTGAGNFDGRQAEDGRLVLFECNPRFSGRLAPTRLAGLDFVSAGIDHHVPQVTLYGDYRPWQDLFTSAGRAALRGGQWNWRLTMSDIYELIRDPLPPVVRKLTGEDI